MEDELFRRSSLSIPHKRSLFEKFHINKQNIRERFDRYLKSTTEAFEYNDQERSRTTPRPRLKDIRKEKLEILSEMNTSTNEQRFYQKSEESNKKLLQILKRKWEKITNVRKEKDIDHKNTEEAMERWEKINKKHIKHMHSSIKESRIKIVQSKMQSQIIKNEIAEELRHISHLDRSFVKEEREKEKEYKRELAEVVRESEKQANLQQSRIIEYKKKCANELKLEKIYRELAEKDEIEFVAAHVKKHFKKTSSQIRKNIELIESKINKYRFSLCERRVITESSPVVKFNENSFSTSSRISQKIRRKSVHESSLDSF